MKKGIYQIEDFLLRQKNYLVIFLSFLVNITLTIVCSVFVDYFAGIYTNNELFYNSKIQLIISVIFIAPLLETFIFQHLIFKILSKYKINNLFYICLSSVSFALIHLYKYENLLEVINIFLIGIILAYAYLLFFKKNQDKAFKSVYFIHLLYNCTILIIYLSNYT